MKSIQHKLDEHRGVGPGFDFLRYFLAFSVVAWHSLIIAEGVVGDNIARQSPLWLYKYAVLPVFFALSGFLITGSANRLSLRNFMLNRGLRIIPALAVEVILSAFVLGVIFTTFPLRQYLTQPEVYRYLLNMVGYIHYTLPGVFKTNPFGDAVNGSLWTIPYEIGCYIIMAGLIYTGWVKKPSIFIWMVVLFFIGSFVYTYTATASFLPYPLWRLGRFLFVSRGLQISGPNLFPFFLTGCIFYVYRARIPHDWRIFAAAAALVLIASVIGDSSWEKDPFVQLLACPLLVYLLAYIGVTGLSPPAFLKRGDYSYGIYLYGFPIQQMLIHLFPITDRWWMNLLLTLPPLILFSMFSWRFIEKPILSLRKNFSFQVRRLEEDDRPGDHYRKGATDDRPPYPAEG